jgi:hypothetical protein
VYCENLKWESGGLISFGPGTEFGDETLMLSGKLLRGFSSQNVNIKNRRP